MEGKKDWLVSSLIVSQHACSQATIAAAAAAGGRQQYGVMCVLWFGRSGTLVRLRLLGLIPSH